MHQNHIILLMDKILHQLIGSLSHYLQGFIHPRWCRILSINSMFPSLAENLKGKNPPVWDMEFFAPLRWDLFRWICWKHQGTVRSTRVITLASSCFNLRGFVKSSIAQKTSLVKSILLLLRRFQQQNFGVISCPVHTSSASLLVLRCGSPIIGEALSRESIKNSVAGPNKPKDLFEIPLSPNDFWELCPFSKAPMVEVKVSAVTPIRTWLAHLVAHVSPSSRTLVS